MRDEATQNLYYATAAGPRPERPAMSPGERALKVLSWTILAICLTVWAVVGALFWVPLLLRRILVYSVALVVSMLSEREPRRAARLLRSAVRFYGRGFRVTAEMITGEPGQRAPQLSSTSEDAPRGALLGDLLWTLLVWYGVLWVTGTVSLTPLDLWRWLAAFPWQERVTDPVLTWIRAHRP